VPHRVTLVQGGGVGFDQVPAVKRVLESAGVRIDWDEHVAGVASLQCGGEPLPKAMFDSVRSTGLALKTTLVSPRGNWNVQFRQELGLFASVRPLKNVRGLKARFQNVDMLVIRELTEDLYAAIEHEIVPGVVQSLKVVTEAACRRFFRFTFEHARGARRKQVTCVHKANIMKLADGLMLEAFRAVAKDFSDLQTRELIVDNCCMQMVSRPQQFDVLAMGNLYGDIVSDLGAGLVGGISATHGINVGDGVRVYESFHGRAVPEGKANPVPLLLPAIDLLEALGQGEAGRRILAALETVFVAGKDLTPDLGGEAPTARMADAIIAALAG
jgi:isocitrate dehydrogenase (NAD+)